MRTDIGVDFVEDKVNQQSSSYHAGIPLVRSLGSINTNHIDRIDLPKFRKTAGMKSGFHSSRWQRGDRVVISDTNEIVQILERGLKGNALIVKIQHLDRDDTPVTELPLLQLMALGNLFSTSKLAYTPERILTDDVQSNPSSTPPQPYYCKYSKPSSHYGQIHNCFARGGKGVDTIDAVTCDIPRIRPTNRRWYTQSLPTGYSPITLTKLLNDPEDFRRKRLFFESCYMVTEKGLKPKPFVSRKEDLDDGTKSQEQWVHDCDIGTFEGESLQGPAIGDGPEGIEHETLPGLVIGDDPKGTECETLQGPALGDGPEGIYDKTLRGGAIDKDLEGIESETLQGPAIGDDLEDIEDETLQGPTIGDDQDQEGIESEALHGPAIGDDPEGIDDDFYDWENTLVPQEQGAGEVENGMEECKANEPSKDEVKGNGESGNESKDQGMADLELDVELENFPKPAETHLDNKGSQAQGTDLEGTGSEPINLIMNTTFTKESA